MEPKPSWCPWTTSLKWLPCLPISSAKPIFLSIPTARLCFRRQWSEGGGTMCFCYKSPSKLNKIEKVRDAYFVKLTKYFFYLIDTVVNNFTLLPYHKVTKPNKYTYLFYTQIFELSVALSSAVNCHNRIAIPILLRSLMEAYVDFHNLLEDAEYVKVLDLSYLLEHKKYLEAALNQSNPYFVGFNNIQEIEKDLETTKQLIKELDVLGIKKAHISEKFSKLDGDDLYRAVYSDLCCDAHNNFKSILKRVSEVPEDETKEQVEVLKPIRPGSIEKYLLTCIGILLFCTYWVHKAHETVFVNEIEKLQIEYKILRNEYESYLNKG
jgi:hypothetical protein